MLKILQRSKIRIIYTLQTLKNPDFAEYCKLDILEKILQACHSEKILEAWHSGKILQAWHSGKILQVFKN